MTDKNVDVNWVAILYRGWHTAVIIWPIGMNSTCKQTKHKVKWTDWLSKVKTNIVNDLLTYPESLKYRCWDWNDISLRNQVIWK